MRRTLLLLSIPLVIIACNPASIGDRLKKKAGREMLAGAKFDRVFIDSVLEMQVYESMNKADDLNKEAAIQFSDLSKGVFLIALKESTDDFADAIHDHPEVVAPYTKNDTSLFGIYSSYTTARLAESLRQGKDSLVLNKPVHGIPCRMYTVTGTLSNLQLYYVMGVFQYRHSLYQVVSWTTGGRRDLYDGIMKKMITSVMETPLSQ